MACPSSLGVLVPSSSVSGSGASASSDIGYCDHQWANNSQLDMALLGGDCGNGVRCGAFACVLNGPVAASNWDIGASPQTKHAHGQKISMGNFPMDTRLLKEFFVVIIFFVIVTINGCMDV